jgi:hypothetical protein
MFCDLPVVFVDDWEEITEDFLKKNMPNSKTKHIISTNVIAIIG